MSKLQNVREIEVDMPFGIALIYVGLGDKNEMFEWLQKG
jgi:hypothetical protein